MKTKGFPRLTNENLDNLTKTTAIKKLIAFSQKPSPGWSELVYLTRLEKFTSRRDFLLGYVFALIEEQYGFALNVAQLGATMHDSSIFSEMEKYALRKIILSIYKLRFVPAVIRKIKSLLLKTD
jgi:hypothetical protein